jgi:hypothetical protein
MEGFLELGVTASGIFRSRFIRVSRSIPEALNGAAPAECDAGCLENQLASETAG